MNSAESAAEASIKSPRARIVKTSATAKRMIQTCPSYVLSAMASGWHCHDKVSQGACCQRINGKDLQTYFGKDTPPFQDDHLFASRDLASAQEGCDVIHIEVTRRVSDHIPLFIELAV